MTNKHTPGPWHRNVKPARKYNTIFAGRNTHVAHLDIVGLTDDEIEGNCDLIAAAPELLGALELLLAEVTCLELLGQISTPMRRAVSVARAAIAKAEGR